MIGSGDFRKVGRVFVTHRAYDHLERSVKPIPAWPLVNNSLYMSLLELQHGARQRLLHENQGFFCCEAVMEVQNNNGGDRRTVGSAGERNLLDCSRPACPVCQGHLIEIRGKLQCSRCHTICETCCEGGRG